MLLVSAVSKASLPLKKHQFPTSFVPMYHGTTRSYLPHPSPTEVSVSMNDPDEFEGMSVSYLA